MVDLRPDMTTAIILEKFSDSNSEQVLLWRNSEAVRENSINNKIITRSEHEKFLQKLESQDEKHYYLVRHDQEAIGTINFRYDDDSILWGCNIADGKTIIPGLFIALIYIAGYYCFEKLEYKSLTSQVLLKNLPPQTANNFLGIKETGRLQEQNDEGAFVDVIQYKTGVEEWPSIADKILSILPKQLRQAVHNIKIEN